MKIIPWWSFGPDRGYASDRKSSAPVSVLAALIASSLLLPLVLVLALDTSAEIMAPGVHHGYFETTRWGDPVLHLGPYHRFLTDSAARELEPYRGRPLRVEVTEIRHGFSSGSGRIAAIGEVVEKGSARGLVLSLGSESTEAEQGEGIEIVLSIRNTSDTAITLEANALALVLVTDSPFRNADIDYRDSTRAYWYYRSGYSGLSLSEGESRLLGCRQIPLPWSGQELAYRGRGVTHRGTWGSFTFAPGSWTRAEMVLGEELLPDDYEVFFYVTSGNFSSIAGPRSNRLAFDVIESR